MKKTKIAAILLSAVLSVSAFSVPTFAADTTTAITATASTSNTWNGKTALETGKTYTVEKSITISKKITIPAKTTVIVKSGCTVTVKSAGALNIKGTLKVEKKATVKVSGTFYLYKSKNVKNYGTINFTSTAKATINGKLYNYSTGVIKGTPKSIKVGTKAKITNKGKIKTEGIIDAEVVLPTSKEISALLDTALSAFVLDGDFSQILKLTMPEEYIAKLVEEMAAAGISLDDYLALLTSQAAITTFTAFDENGKEVEVPAIDVVSLSSKVENIKAATAEELAAYQATLDAANEKYGFAFKAESGCTADITLTVTTVDGTTYSSETESLSFVTIGGKLYAASFATLIA